jgi:hypothetical protein
MKFLGLFLFVLSPLFAQNEIITNPQIGVVYTVISDMEEINGYHFYGKLIFEITRGPNGEKIFTFQLRSCANWTDTSYEGGSTPAEAKLALKFNGGCGQLNSASDAIAVGVGKPKSANSSPTIPMRHIALCTESLAFARI